MDDQYEHITVEIGETSGSSPNTDPRVREDEETEVAKILKKSVELSEAARERVNRNRCIKLYRAALKGDWNAAKTVIDEQKEENKKREQKGKLKEEDIVRRPINSNLETALHIAVATKHKVFVRNLLGEMNSNDLALKNKDNNTALYFAAASGVVEIAEMLIKKNESLPDIAGGGEITPIHMAALFGHEEMVIYLYDKTKLKNLTNINLRNLFLAIVSADIYDVALRMLQEMAQKNLAISQNSERDTALHLMARKPSTISHKGQLNLFQKLANSIFQGSFREAKKLTSAHRLVDELWNSILQLPEKDVLDFLKSHSRLFFNAAESGNVEFLVILIDSYPNLIWKVDDKSRSLFHVAALNRHESIFKIINDLGGIKDLIASYKDNGSKNNLLHLVARLPPPNRLQVVSGAALQMQRELLWFEAVQEMVPRSYIKAKNNDGEVAHDLFMKEHENLRKDGEKWMKETATSCMLVATLIATVVFASAFTLPGGNDSTAPGFPQFRKKDLFDIFILSDSVALLSSVTAILIFLSILTSRYAEGDFRTTLPTKLMLGLLALFVSIISMVLAFTSAMVLIRDQEPLWSLILIICLAFLTAISFALLHSRLWFETLRSLLTKFLFHGRKSRRLFR